MAKSPETALLSELRANILLVDDQPANLLALRAILQDLGHNLVEAHSTEEVETLLRTETFAVILLQMNDLDGYSTAKLIRSQERSRNTPVIFQTAYETDRFHVEEAYALGAVDYLVKPLVPFILRAKVAWFVKFFQNAEQAKRQVEADRQEAEERLRMMVESVKDYAIFSLDVRGRIVSWNTGAAHLLGYGEAEVLGKHFSIFFTPEDNETGRPERELQRAASEGSASNNNWTVRKDGSRFWAEGSTYPLRNGELPGYVTIFRDLTERKQMEEALRASTQSLVEKEKRRNEFLAMLGHELRNPLNPIVTSLAVLRQEKPTSPLIEQAHAIMERQAKQLVRLVDDLLDVARITRGQIELRKERVELSELIDQVVEAVAPLLAARRHDLSVSAPRGMIWLNVDPARIQQILVNLLTNACKYTPVQGEIRLRVHQEGENVAISVKDNGVGIAPEMLPKVFDLFTQAERSLARSEGGLGIGLTMVKNLVEMHGGSVVARSEGLGKGSEFIIRLSVLKPRHAIPAETPSRTAELPAVPLGKSYRVLVVDDNVDAARSLALLLRSYGHEVVDVVHDGPSAVEAILTKKPSVVLLDIGLPGMNGYEVAQRVRKKEIEQPPHLIAVTGYGLESDKVKAQEVGIDHYIVKPVDPHRLHEIFSMIGEKR